MAFVRNVDQHPGQECQWVDGLEVPAVGPSDLSGRSVTALAARSNVCRSSATGLRAQQRASLAAKARSSSAPHRGVDVKPACGHVSMLATWES